MTEEEKQIIAIMEKDDGDNEEGTSPDGTVHVRMRRFYVSTPDGFLSRSREGRVIHAERAINSNGFHLEENAKAAADQVEDAEIYATLADDLTRVKKIPYASPAEKLRKSEPERIRRAEQRAERAETRSTIMMWIAAAGLFTSLLLGIATFLFK